MVTDIHISQEIFAIDMLTACLKHDRKHVVQLLQLYGDQAIISVTYNF